jgi:hypothetical protein
MHKQISTILFLTASLSAQTIDEQINALIDQKIAAALAELELPDHRHPLPEHTHPLPEHTHPEMPAPAPTPAPTPEPTPEPEPLPDDLTGLRITELSHQSIELHWDLNSDWSHPYLIQRASEPRFTAPTNLKNNQSLTTFRWLGIRATNYVDLDSLAPGTRYYYRVAAVTNLEATTRGATPEFSPWLYGSATTTVLPPSQTHIYDITHFGAQPDDGENDYPAIRKAQLLAEAAGGGVVYFPAGTWDIWPTSTSLTTLFPIRSDNITFAGVSAAQTRWKLYLADKRPATEWHTVNGTVRRYFVFKPHDVSGTTLRNLDVDMGAPPVNTGKEWYTNEQKKYQWDISHKFWAAHDTTRGKNTTFENLRIRNCRGEIIYVGGSSEKMLIKNCVLERSNSSSISGSVDLEIVNTTVRDSSNAAVESTLKSTRAGLDGQPFAQNHIARGCTFIGMDRSDNGVMQHLPGRTDAFSGWHVFNESGTYQTVTDSRIADTIKSALGPWYEYRNGFVHHTTFDTTPGFDGYVFYLNTTAQSAYTLAGGMSHILWADNTVLIRKDWGNGKAILYTNPGSAANGNQSPWHIIDLTLQAHDGPHRVNRFWIDLWSQPTGRQDVLFKNITTDNVTVPANHTWIKTPDKRIAPTFENVFK